MPVSFKLDRFHLALFDEAWRELGFTSRSDALRVLVLTFTATVNACRGFREECVNLAASVMLRNQEAHNKKTYDAIAETVTKVVSARGHLPKHVARAAAEMFLADVAHKVDDMIMLLEQRPEAKTVLDDMLDTIILHLDDDEGEAGVAEA